MLKKNLPHIFHIPVDKLIFSIKVSRLPRNKNSIIVIKLRGNKQPSHHAYNGGLDKIIPKRQGSLGSVGIMGFVLTNFPADNYGTSSGDDEGNCVYN